MNKIKIMMAAVLIGCAGLSTAHAQDRLSAQERTAVHMVIEDQLAALRSNDGPAAYSLAAPAVRQMFPTPDLFMRMIETGYAPFFRARDVVFTRAVKLDDGSILQEVSLTGPNGTAYVAAYTLARQRDGRWQITGCILKDAPGRVI